MGEAFWYFVDTNAVYSVNIMADSGIHIRTEDQVENCRSEMCSNP